MSNRAKKTTTTTEDNEVDQLLRAAHDDVLLKLNLNSHMARGAAASSASIDPDLDRRFQALKRPQKPTTTRIDDDSLERKSSPPPKLDAAAVNGSKIRGADDDGGDLFARFAALKSSIPSYDKKNERQSKHIPIDHVLIYPKQVTGDEESEEEDEVEKVIKWAIDAARLDPSPPSDNDDTDNDDEDDDTEDDDGVDSRKKGKKK